MNKPLSSLAAGCVALCAVAVLHANGITAPLTNLNADDYELRQAARLELRQTLVDASPRELRALERELLQAIGPDRDWATRDWSIRMLELVGTKAAVKPLAALLDDPDARIRDLARRALSANPSGRAASALQQADAKASADEHAAYIDALAYRHENRSVRQLTALLRGGSADAALALGKIGNRSARSALSKARAQADAGSELKRDIELALLDAGLTDRRLAQALAESGESDTIRSAAFARLLELDARAAAAVLDAALAGPDSPQRALLLRAAMSSSLHDDVVARLPDLPEPEQIVVLDAIADLHLSRHEAAVLALLDGASEALLPVAVRTLGHVGSDASFQPLLDRYLADERDRDVTGALARLQAPSTDASLLTTLQGDGDVSERVAALRLLVLRNTAGVTALVNQLAQADHPADLREAAFRGMEVVGDAESVRVLLGVVLANDELKRPAQSSLKKLSANLSVPDYLWTSYYAPAMAAATDDGRRDVLAIVDGTSGRAAADDLLDLALGGGPLKAEALNALKRWTDISGVDAWLKIAAADGAEAADVAAAQQSILRILASTRTTGLYGEKVDRAVAALHAFANDTEFKQALLKVYDGELHWQTRMRINQTFPEFLEDATIAAEVQALLDRAKFN